VKNIPSDPELLDGIRNRERAILVYVYEQFYPMIREFILKNSGTEEDARDIFQEGLVVIFEKLKAGQIELTSRFKTFLYAICRNKWLMVLRKRRTGPQLVVDTQLLEENQPASTEDLAKHQQYQLYRMHFKKLSDDCRKLLNNFLKGYSLKEIGELMGFTEMYAKKRKFLCQKKLIASIEADPMFRELKD
jgi:RNA polymerase sigma factor (sigma-70 family)